MATTRRLKRSQYRLLGLVGHGQFGRVYCAVHRRTGELVALKDLNRDRFSTHKFLRELRFLLSLEHPNIATCHALEHSETGRQLVLDYCEGGTLRYLIENEVPLNLGEILDFITDLLQAIEHAHRQGIVHCDIKPENVLLSIRPGGWQAKISDFGIARLSQENSESEMGQTGSPAYMAPERFYNQHPASSDLYSVGIMLYELLVGHRPFSGTPAELMLAHLNQRPVMPESLPTPLAELVAKALQKLLAKRYKTATEMLMAVRAVKDQLPLESLSVWVKAPIEAPLPAPALPFVTLPHPVETMGLVNMPLKRGESAEGQEVASPILLVGYHQQLWFYHWTDKRQDVLGDTQGLTLPWAIREVTSTSYGGCLLTDHSIHLLSIKHGLVAIARFDHAVKADISPDGQWFVACNLKDPDNEVQLILRRLVLKPTQPIKTSTLTRVALSTVDGQITAVVVLDRRYCLVAIKKADRTEFRTFSRRGTLIGTIHLATGVVSLTPTSRPYRFLALEADAPNAVLVIDFKPFRVTRYRLDIHPRWLISTEAGYVAISSDGKLRLISEEGHVIGQIDRLPKPSCITFLPPTQLLWAVSEPTYSRIYTVDLKLLGLEIIF